MKTRWTTLLVALWTAVALSVRPAHATEYFWTKPSGTGLYFDDPANWTPGGYPDDASDVAIFNLSSQYALRFRKNETNRKFEVRAGTVSLYAWNSNFTTEYTYTLDPLFPSNDAAVIGATAGPLATLALVGDVNADAKLQIGRDAGSNGKLRLVGVEYTFGFESAEWTSSWPTLVGDGGTGELELLEYADLTDGGSVLGDDSGSVGTASVGFSCDWDSTGLRTIGGHGSGTLTVAEYGYATNDGDGEIAAYGGSTGTVTVNGNWQNNASLYVGGTSAGPGGSGTLIVDGGYVSVSADMKVWPAGTVTMNNSLVSPFTVEGQLETIAGSRLTLNEGKLSLGSAAMAAGTFDWTGGTLEFPSAGTTVELNEGLGAALTVPSGGTLSVFGAVEVGPEFAGTLTVLGGTVTSASGVIGSTEESSVAAVAIMQGSGASWTMPGDLTVRGHNTADVSVVGGARLSNDNAFVAATPGTNAEIGLSDADTEWNNSGSVYLGGDGVGSAGAGTLDVLAGAAMNVAGTLKVWDDFDVNISDSVLSVGSLEVTGSVQANDGSVVNVPGGSVTVAAGGTLVAAITGDAATAVTLQGAGSSWSMSGSLETATSTSGSGHVGTLTLGSETSVTAAGTVEVLDNHAFILGGGTIHASRIELADNDFVGWGTLHGDVVAGGNVIASGTLTIGDSASHTGVQIEGNLVVGPHTVTVNKAGFFNIGTFTDISGGTLNVPGGVAIPVGNSLIAFGTINGRLAAQAGSTIEATGNLSLGDAASPAGFFSDGELSVHDHTVTIYDANEAALGSLTTLGDDGNPGTLLAGNGAVVDFGKNVVGFGIVDTPDDPSRPLINNGNIIGNSPAEPITLSGYVKGVGTCDNCNITGTDAPGFSTAAVNRGSVSYNGTLEIEIGGVTPGSGHDQLNHILGLGVADLGGTLDLKPVPPYDDPAQPGEVDVFAIILAASVVETFAEVLYDSVELQETFVDGMVIRSHQGQGLFRILEYASAGVTWLNYQALPGDANGDLVVDVSDFNIWNEHKFSDDTTWATGDFNGDGITDVSDLNIWNAYKFTQVEGVVAVPEPLLVWPLVWMASFVVQKSRRPRHRIHGK